MNEALIEKHLSPEARADLGEVILFEEIDSTNAESLRLLKAGKTGSWIVLAQSQIAGRGRSGRTWSSYKGAGIYLSLVRRFTLAADALQSLSLVTAISLHAALTALGVQNLQLKWPNDVLHEKRKLAGILLELHKMESTLHVVLHAPSLVHGRVNHVEVDDPSPNETAGQCGLDGLDIKVAPDHARCTGGSSVKDTAPFTHCGTPG